MCPLVAWLIGGTSSKVVDFHWWYILYLRLSSVLIPWLPRFKTWTKYFSALHNVSGTWPSWFPKSLRYIYRSAFISADLVLNLLVISHPARVWTAGKTSHSGCPKLFASTCKIYLVCWPFPVLNQSSVSPFDLKHLEKYTTITKTSVSFERINQDSGEK